MCNIQYHNVIHIIVVDYSNRAVRYWGVCEYKEHTEKLHNQIQKLNICNCVICFLVLLKYINTTFGNQLPYLVGWISATDFNSCCYALVAENNDTNLVYSGRSKGQKLVNHFNL